MTKFGCGGYSVGIGTSHSLFDGPATFDFVRAWASNSAVMKEKGGDELHKPVHERGTLLVGNCDAQKAKIRAAAIDHLYQLIQQAAITDQNPASTDHRKQGDQLNLYQMGCSNYVLKTFHLTGAMIEKLKGKILGERRGNFSCSSFEVVTAHLWKVIFAG